MSTSMPGTSSITDSMISSSDIEAIILFTVIEGKKRLELHSKENILSDS